MFDDNDLKAGVSFILLVCVVKQYNNNDKSVSVSLNM